MPGPPRHPHVAAATIRPDVGQHTLQRWWLSARLAVGRLPQSNTRVGRFRLDITPIVARAAQRRAGRNNGPVEIKAIVVPDAVADLTVIALLPGDGARHRLTLAHEGAHRGRGALASRRAALHGVDAFESHEHAVDEEGVAVDDADRPGDSGL